MLGIFRFILALNVVIFHITHVKFIGPAAVITFFVLSGFLMTLIMQTTYGYTISGFKRYALNRFYRLFPVYWALLVITIISISFVGQDFALDFHPALYIPKNIIDWVNNVTLLFIDFRPISITPRLAPATWALTIEIVFYVLIGLGISKSKNLTLIWLIMSLIYFVYINLTQGFGIDYGTIFSASLPFSIGAATYHFKSELSNFFKGKIALFVTIIFFINIIFTPLMVFFISKSELWKVFFLGHILNLGLSSLVVLILFNYDSKVTYSHFAKALGDLSYPIYVFHWAGMMIVYFAVEKWLPKFNDSLFLKISLGLIFVILVSYFVDKIISRNVEIIRMNIKFGKSKPS